MAVSMQKALNYVKNVGSSFGYAAIDMVKEYDVADSISSNLETIKDLYSDIKDFKSSPADKVKSNQKIMSYSNDIKTGIENLKSDIRTGQWYNKTRSDDAMAKLMGIDFDFDDFDFDFNMDEEDTKADVIATMEGTQKEILAMDIVGSKVSTAVSSATAKSAEYIVNANAESTRSLINQNNKIFSVLSTGMVGVNKTLGEIAKISQPLTVHMQNASTFYTKSTENQLKMISLLEKIEANTRKPEPKKSTSKSNVLGMDDYMDANGILSIRAILDNAKKNGKEAFDNTSLGMLLSMNDMFGEGTMTKMFASNPIGMITTMVLPSLIVTDELKKSLDKFSKALSAASNKALRDLNKYKNDWNHPVLGFISSLFGFSEGRGEKIGRPGEYEKGAVSFDGYTKQAITKVIPEYLSMILSAIDGQSQRLYDYERGKFTNRSEIKENVEKEFKRTVNSASYDFKTAAENTAPKSAKKRRTDIGKLVDKYVGNAIRTNNLIVGPGQVIDPKDYSKYGFSNQEELADFLSIISAVTGKDSTTWPELELLNHNIHAVRIRNEKSSYGQLDTEMYLYDGSEYEYANSINGAIANLQSMGRSKRKKNKGGANKSKSNDEAAVAGAATGRIISKYSVEQELKDSGLSEDSAIFKKISKKAEELEKKDRLTDKEIEDFEDLLDKTLKDASEGKLNKVDKGYESVKGFMGRLRNFIGAPLDAAKDIIDKGSETLRRLMYGKEGEEDDKSILGHIFINMKQLFTDFKDWTKETIFDPIKKKLDSEGGLVKMILKFFGIDEEKEKKLKEVKQNVKNRFKSVGKWFLDSNIFVKQYRAYKARKAGREAGENWSAYANNEPFAEGPDESGFGSGLTKFYAKKFRGGASEQTNTNNATDNRNFFENTRDEFKNAASSFIHAIFPSKKDLDSDMQKAADATKNAYGELKKDPSAAITGALIGAGVSLLTGGIVGPFLGAALGGATGLTIGSEKVQRALFGDDIVDEEGKAAKSGGIFGAKLSTFLARDLSKVTQYGVNGAVISLLPFIPGGPITGLMVGSAIGFANREGKLEQKLFGTMGEDGRNDDGLISKEFQDKVKKLLPKAAVGATLGILAGPFGLLGNIILGAGLGFASESEKFKSIIFGAEDENGERTGGITGWIRKDIIKPVADALVPIAVEIKNKGTDIIRWTVRSISNVFGKIVATPVKDKLVSWLDSSQASKGFIGAVAKVVGGTVALPFRAIGGIGRNLRRKQVRTGRANDMTAKARLKYRNEQGLGVDEFTDFDTILADMEESEINDYINGLKNARKSKDQEAINSEVNKFSTRFGLQNLNITDKNIDKYMDNLVSEKRQRKNEAAKLSPDQVRNQLMESHYNKIENMVGAIANKIFKRKIFDTNIPGDLEESENNEEEQTNTPGSVTTRRSTRTVVKSLFNPFTGMDMESVREAISYYEDRFELDQYNGNIQEIRSRVKKVEVNGVLRDDIIEVTDKNGYTVIVQKVNGSWMPYKWGSQLMESLKGSTVGKIVTNTVVAAKAVGRTITTIYKMITQNPFVGMDMDVVNKALGLFFKKKDMTLTANEKEFYDNHVKELNTEYPDADVIEVSDDNGHSTVARYDWDEGKWKYVGITWKAKFKAKQAMKSVGRAITKVASKIKGVVLNVLDNIRHINPFCDFEPEEVGPIIESLNSIEFDGGSDQTGKIKRVEGLSHYYQVTSKNGTVVTVTAENGKWTFVSDKRLAAARAKTLTMGIGGMITNTARSLINSIGNRNNAEAPETEPVVQPGYMPEGSGSGLVKNKNYRGSGFFSTLRGIFSSKGSSSAAASSAGTSALGSLGDLFGGSDKSESADNDSSIDSALEKINKEKFDPTKYLKLTGENAGKNLNNKEVREAERQRQSTLNIFRQSNYTEEQISKKMDVLINGLVGSGGAGSGKRKGILGSILGFLTSSLGMVLGGSLLGAGLYSGKLDKPLEGMYQSVAGDNTKAGSGGFSSVTITDPNTGEIVELATSKGDPIIETDEEGNSFYVTVYGDKIPVDPNNPPQFRGTQGFASKIKSYLLPKAILSGNKNGLISMPRTIISKGLKNSKSSWIRRGATAADQWIDDVLYGGIKNKGESFLSKIPGVAGLEEKLASTKFGNFYLKQAGKEASQKGAKNTAERFMAVFGKKDYKKYLKEFAESGYDDFVLKHYDDLGSDTLKYLTEHADDVVEGGFKKQYTNGLQRLGENVSKFLKKNSVEAVEKATVKESVKGMKETILEAFDKLANSLCKNRKAIKALGSSEAVEQAIKELGEEVAEKASKEAAEKATEAVVKEGADFIPIGGLVFAVVCAIYEFEEGWNSAERTWKVLNPNLIERFVSAIVPSAMQLVGAIPGVVVVDWLPWDWMMSKVVDILEKHGVNLKELSKQRDEAQKYLDEINKKRLEKNPGASEWSFEELAVASEKEGGLNARTWGERALSATKTALNRFGTEATEKSKKAAKAVKDFKDGLISKEEFEKQKKEGEFLTEEDFLTGFGSKLRGGSFVSQVDPSIAGKRFGNLTIGANGCAPSVASMITGAPLNSTANYALKGGYVDNTGTSADYFSSVLGSAGIPSEFVYTGGNSATDYLASRIAGGSPTVLLGQDPYNTSKANSPFGPGNHYVLATGMTNDGGVVVQDPESRTPNQIYDSSILNSVKLGIPTGAGSKKRALKRALKRFRGGSVEDLQQYGTNYSYNEELATKMQGQPAQNGRDKGYSSSMDWYNQNVNVKKKFDTKASAAAREEANKGSIRYQGGPSSMDGYNQNLVSGYTGDLSVGHQQIWTYLIRKGISEEGAAALMGCWQAESGNRPDRIEGDYMKSFPGFSQVASSSEAMDNYVLNILFPATEKNVKINRNAYKGSDGHYYPGFGLAQWTGPRTQNLLEFAKSKNQDWKALGTQLDFAMQELSTKYSSVLTAIKQKGRDINELTKIVFNKYEGSKKADWLVKRQQYANHIYTEFTGKSFGMPSYNGTDSQIYSSSASGAPSTGTSGESGTSSSSSSSGGIFDFIGKFGELIAAKFGKLAQLVGLGKSEDEENGENGSSGGYNSSSSFDSGSWDGGSNYKGTGDYTKVLKLRPGRPNSAQQALVEKMKSIQGTISYSQSGPRNPDAGSADCSSTVNWAYKNIVGIDVGNNTPAIMQSANLSTVDMSDIPISGGENGSGPTNPGLLMPGDLLLYSRPGKSFSAGRPYSVGHVEMYMGDGQTIGHGGPDKGPKIKQLSKDAHRYIMARRLNNFISLDDVLNEENKNSLRNKGYSSSMDGYNPNKNSIRNQGGPSSMEGYTGGASNVNPKQDELVNQMRSVEGKLEYSMSGPRDPNKGSADCSSTVGWAYKNVLGIDIGTNTEAILRSNALSTIDQSDLPYQGGTGSGPNLSNLQPGDLILSSRPKGDYTKGRPYRVGHVEMYIGDGQTIGHGGPGLGPVVKPIETAKYIMGRRANDLVNEDSLRNQGYSNSMDMAGNNGIQARINSNNLTSKGYTAADESKNIITPTETTAAPNVLENVQEPTTPNLVDMFGTNNGLAYNSNLGNKLGGKETFGAIANNIASGSGLTYNIAQDGLNTIRRKHKSSKSAFGGGSGIYNLSKFSKYRKNKYYKDLRGGASLTGEDDKEILIAMIKGIITLLSNVSANSDKIGDIASAIGDMNSASSQNFGTSINALKNDVGIRDTDETIEQMKNLLNNLAAG